METKNYFNQEIVNRLQHEAELFLRESKLVLNGLVILPKDIEVYYYSADVFEDSSVHQNELQRNNMNHFYIHRKGKTQSDPYKGGNYAGLDFVLSDKDSVYYTYLIRSAVINDTPIIGPHKTLEFILARCGYKMEELENAVVEIYPNDIPYDVLFSSRINLGKNAKEFSDCKLRAVLCDDWFKMNKYPAKEKLIVDFLFEKIRHNNLSKERAMEYAKRFLGYIPTSIRTYEN